MIILDTHLKDIPYVQVAKEIVNRTLDQRIIFTTTLPSDRVRQDIDSMGIKNNKNEILTKRAMVYWYCDIFVFYL